MFASLMGSRRFAPLFWCQFLSAFNDNFVRQMLALTILFQLSEAQSGPLVPLAVAIFVLPSIFLSALGGEIADANDKAVIARRLKFAEIFVQSIAAAGFWFASLSLLFTALFGLGLIAALFGPIKYGILPDHLETRELPAGNALIEGATFMAILLGLIVGGYAADSSRAPWTVAIQLMIVAFACWGTSRFIPSTGAAAPSLKVNPNIFASTWAMLVDLKSDRRNWIGGIAVGFFWMTGAVALSLVPVVIKTRIGGGQELETMVSALFAIGVALGSVLAKRWKSADVDPFSATAWQMIAAGVGNLLFAVGAGDFSRVVWTPRGIGATVYLVVCGSWIGYTAYIWLLNHVPTSKVSTYAYVNPVVAVFLGWLVLSEPVSGYILAGSAIVVASVVLVTSAQVTKKLAVEELAMVETTGD